ncbi:ligase [Streptomyces griseoaurantiacus M045]|uniref:Lipid II isoglutaminyl synthase (glutamine-hydrolyzing) subunit MurT n=3 Tax=Streptomyces griseoaurantiacus TaxID=68213 RepID=F3NTQ5_9ACTN|nr:ligase [Streptomyces griseoaurantiacus M045]
MPSTRSGSPVTVRPSSTVRSYRGVAASRPGSERHPSGPRTLTPSLATSRGFTRCPRWRTPSSSSQSKTNTRSGSPTWWAARPTPRAAYMVANMSSTSAASSGPNAVTSAPGARSTGSPSRVRGRTRPRTPGRERCRMAVSVRFPLHPAGSAEDRSARAVPVRDSGVRMDLDRLTSITLPTGFRAARTREDRELMAGNSDPLSPRAKLAVTAGKAVAAASRAAGRGSGSVIGGKVALRLDPDLLARLAQNLDVVLVSATNGKTTTTRLIAEALRAAGPVVSNALGANMPAGITSALAGGSESKYGVIEVDEKYLAGVARDTDPKCIALLNLSRDQLDRAAETRMLAENWREGLAGSKAVIVANADDPLVVWAASSSPNVIWVAAGQMWKDDAWSCPSCGGVMQRPGDDWFCGECGFRRPVPSWALSGDHVLDPHGSAWPIHLQLPGRANKANAASSAAVAAVFGVPPQVALERMYQVQAVAGRYDVVQFQGRDLRLLLAKNPAGWLETFSLIDPPPTPVILSVNARGADGTDTSWLWDVDYTRLTGHPIFVLGDRKLDLAVRLEVANQSFQVCDSLDQAVQAAPPGRIEVIANYTAFQDLRRRVGN